LAAPAVDRLAGPARDTNGDLASIGGQREQIRARRAQVRGFFVLVLAPLNGSGKWSFMGGEQEEDRAR